MNINSSSILLNPFPKIQRFKIYLDFEQKLSWINAAFVLVPCEEELKFFYLIVGDTKAIEDAVMLITLTEQMQITYVRIDALTLTKKMLSD